MALPVNGSTHLIPAYYSIYRPRKDERLSWPSWLTYSGWLTHISGQQRIRLSIETLCIYLVPLSRYIVGVAIYRKKHIDLVVYLVAVGDRPPFTTIFGIRKP